MFQLPQPVPWEGAHVLLVHLPIGLLLFLPLMLAAAIVLRRWGRQFAAAAGFVLLAGTLACQLAAMSGEAAEELAEEQGIEASPAAHEVLEAHEEAGAFVRNFYAVLTLLFWGYLAVTGLRKPLGAGADCAVLALALVAACLGAVALARTGHLGGELVHEHGILAPLTPEAAAASAAAAAAAGEGVGTEEDED